MIENECKSVLHFLSKIFFMTKWAQGSFILMRRFGKFSSSYDFNLFLAIMFPFDNPWKHQKLFGFSGALRGYKIGTLAGNRLIDLNGFMMGWNFSSTPFPFHPNPAFLLKYSLWLFWIVNTAPVKTNVAKIFFIANSLFAYEL